LMPGQKIYSAQPLKNLTHSLLSSGPNKTCY
jgi:hypothetical protein